MMYSGFITYTGSGEYNTVFSGVTGADSLTCAAYDVDDVLIAYFHPEEYSLEELYGDTRCNFSQIMPISCEKFRVELQTA